jgi:hypothetical protein
MGIQAFAGLYEFVAEKNGYFQDAGLDYEIVRGNRGPRADATKAPLESFPEGQRLGHKACADAVLV